MDDLVKAGVNTLTKESSERMVHMTQEEGMSDAQALFVCVCVGESVFAGKPFTPEEEQLVMALCPYVDVNQCDKVCVCGSVCSGMFQLTWCHSLASLCVWLNSLG